MSLLDQAVRLLRTHWRNPTALAQELYAMFTAQDAATQDAPLTIANPDGSTAPYLQLPNYTPGNSLIQINGRGGAPLGNLVLEGDSLVFQPAQTGALPTGTVPFAPGTTRPLPIGGGGGGGVPGQVVSQVSGSVYQVRIYPAGLNGASQLVNVTQLSIASGAVIPAGTWTTVINTTDGSYEMQVPVWGASS